MIHTLGLSPSLDVVYVLDDRPDRGHPPAPAGRPPRRRQVAERLARPRPARPRRYAPSPRWPARSATWSTSSSARPASSSCRLPSSAPTRMCVTAADASAGTLTEFYEQAPPADGTELDHLDPVLAGARPRRTGWCCRAASRPGPTSTASSRCWRRRGERGVRLAVDTHGAVLPLLLEVAAPDVVKINRSEAAELVGADPADLVELGAAVRAAGADVLVLTDGTAGAVGWDDDGGVAGDDGRRAGRLPGGQRRLLPRRPRRRPGRREAAAGGARHRRGGRRGERGRARRRPLRRRDPRPPPGADPGRRAAPVRPVKVQP